MTQQLFIKERIDALRNNDPESTVAKFLRAQNAWKNFLIVSIARSNSENKSDWITRIDTTLVDSNFEILETGSFLINPPTAIKDWKFTFRSAYDQLMSMCSRKKTIICTYKTVDAWRLASEINRFWLPLPAPDPDEWLGSSVSIEMAAVSLLGLESNEDHSLEKIMRILDIEPVEGSCGQENENIHDLAILLKLFRSTDV